MSSLRKSTSCQDGQIRIAHLYAKAQRCGGAERSILSLVRGINNEQFRSYLVLCKRLPESEELSLGGICAFPRRSTSPLCEHLVPSKRLRASVRHIWLARLIKGLDVDILHIHSASGDGYRIVAAMCKFRRVRIIRTVRGDPTICCRGNPSYLKRRVDSWSDRWVVISPDHVASLEATWAIPRRNIMVIPNGIDLDRYSKPKVDRRLMRQQLRVEGAFVLLSVGRLHPYQKDYETLLRAFEIVRKSLQHAKLLIAGEGDGLPEIRCAVQQLHLESDVQLLGHREDVPELMAAADALVFSTRFEGFGRVAAEAMAAGLPVVASNVNGVRYVCDYGRAGLLCEPRDHEDMARSIIAVARRPALRQQLVDRGRERACNEFSEENMVRRHEDLYLSLMTRSSYKRGSERIDDPH